MKSQAQADKGRRYVIRCACGQLMTVTEAHFGRTGKCVKCGRAIRITRRSAQPFVQERAQQVTREVQGTVAPEDADSAPPTKPQEGLLQADVEADVPVEWSVGDVILDLYEVTGELGEGGMGKVYRVRHRGWNMDLAVKSPRPDAFKTTTQRESFVHECETWIDLGLHPHTVSCYYVRVLGGIPRVFAEYVEGGSLKDWIDDGRLYEGGHEKARERILDIAIQFAWGLHYAHEQGLVHQDVKPANVMMTPDGTAKVTDFGLARARAAAGEITEERRPGQSIRVAHAGFMTPEYASPEQAAGKPLTCRTDIYSWAVSVIEMFMGGIAWSSGTVVGETLKQYRQEGPSEEHLPALPERIADLLASCLQENPEERPKDMLSIVGALQQIYKDTEGNAYARVAPKPAETLADSLNNRAVSLVDLGKGAEAEKLLDEALKLHPHHPEATYNRGLLLWRSSRLADDALVTQLEEVRKSHAHDWHDEYYVGLVHIERGDAESALDVPQKAVAEAGDAPDVRQALEEARNGHGKWRGCLRTFKGHASFVDSVSISPDGRWALSGSHDKTLRLWELAAGRCLRTFEGHTDGVASVSISPDGRWGLSGSWDKTLQLWELATGRCLRTFEGPTESVECVNISPDGRWALSGSLDMPLRLWDLATGRCLCTFEGHTSWVNSVSISPDGRWGLSGSEDKTLRLWELTTGRSLRTFEGHTGGVRSVSISPDGRWALSGSDDTTLRLWELATGRCVRTFQGHTQAVTSVSISPDGRWALSGGADHTLRLWELDWEYEFPDPADWDEGARPYLESFLTLHTAYTAQLTRRGTPVWTEENFKQLLYSLGCAGYGWLRPEGVRNELVKMAKNWDGPPPLTT